MKPATVSQNEMLFIRGKAMSGAPIISGTNQLPKPPIIAGMTMKNTMIRPCAVISTFHMWSVCVEVGAAAVQPQRDLARGTAGPARPVPSASGPRSRRR